MLYKDFVREKTHHLTKIKSAEGYPCVFDKSKGKALKDYKVYGNRVQDGTPTPEAPIEFSCVGDLTTKNLFNYADYTTLTNYEGKDISAKWLTIDGDLFYIKYDYYNGSGWLTPTKQWELSSGTYTLSGKCKDNTIKGNPNICYCGVRWSDDTRNAGWGKINSNDGEWYSFSYTFTISETKIVKGVYLQDNGGQAKSAICFTNIQLEEGSSVTEYEPYHKYKIPVLVRGKNIFGGTAFRDKLIELGGTLNEKNKTVTIGADKLNNKVLFDKFDANKRYTFIFSGYNTKIDANYVNVRVIYSDDTYQHAYFNSTNAEKGTWYYKSTENKSLKNISGYWSTGTTVFYYEECGIFEGAISESEFEPYQETQTNIFINSPLRRYGNTDYISFKKQKAIRQTGYKKITANTLKSLTTSLQTYAVKPNIIPSGGGSTIGSYHAQYGYTGAFHWYVNNTGVLFLFSPSEDITLGEYFTNLDIQTDVEFFWKTSTTTEQAIELPSVLTLKDNNIITTTTTVTPSNIEVKYIAK